MKSILKNGEIILINWRRKMNKYSGSLFYLSTDSLKYDMIKSNDKTSFYTKIEGCLLSMNDNIDGKEFYVYILDSRITPIIPSKDDVPNIRITHERWIFGNVKIRCIGKIRVEKTDDGYTYTTINEMG